MPKNGFFVYFDKYLPLKNLSYEQKGKILEASYCYNAGEDYSFDDPVCELAFSYLKQGYDFFNERAEAKSGKYKESGKLGGLAKARNAKERLAMASNASEDVANASDDKQCLANCSKNKNKNNIYNTPLTPQGGNGYPEDFEKLWSAYPKHKSKGAAFKAYVKAKKAGILPDNLLERIQTEAQCADWTKDNGQYVPHMSTWLNQQGWEDDDAQPAPVWVDPHREHHLIMNEIAEKYGPWGPRYYDGETDEDYNIREEKMIAEAVKRGVPEDYARGDSRD